MAEQYRVLYLASIGNRDLLLDDQPIPPDQVRQKGEEICRGFDRYQDRLSAPIIEPCLRYVRDRGRPEQPVRLRIRLFGTDQDPASGLHYQRDTIHLAQALAKLLEARFRRTESFSIEEAPRAVAVRGNPALYDEMYEEFKKLLAARQLEPGQLDNVYVSPVGGTPAMSFGLMLRAIERYGPKCSTIYVLQGNPHVVRLETNRQLQASTLRVVIREQLQHWEFGRVERLLKELGDGGPGRDSLVGLAAYAEARLAFDFDRAALILEDQVIGRADSEARELGVRLRPGLEMLRQGDLGALIQELYYNTLITLQNGRYVDFLLRLFRLVEAALRLIVERELGLPTEAERGGAHPRFKAGVEASPELRAHFEQPYKGEKLDYTRAPTRPVLRHLLDYLIDSSKAQRARYGGLVPLLDRLESLADLRNRSIGGHGFEGVSEEKIEQSYGRSIHDLQEDLGQLIRVLDRPPGDNPFREVRDFIYRKLG